MSVAWLVAEGEKGHVSEDMHRGLVHHLAPLIPRLAQVVLLGDGEFHGVLFQHTVTAHGWTYVCRTASHLPIHLDDDGCMLRNLASPGQCVGVRVTGYTHQHYGPVTVIA